MSKHFFKPRIGTNYAAGFDKLRTLIVAPHMICQIACPHKDKCADSAKVWDMDTECPEYADLDPQVMCLSNANDIEVSAYINGEGAYPAYSAFTYYMLGKQDYLTKADKERLWESAAFTNFLQHLRPAEEPCEPALYEQDYEAFKEAYNTIDPKPEVLYVWNTDLKDCLRKHPADFKYVGKTDMGYALSLFIFVPADATLKPKALQRLRTQRNIKSTVHFDGWYKKLVAKYLGASFEGTEKQVKAQMHSLAEKLKYCVDSGWLGADEECLYFRDSDIMKWTTVHKGYFVKVIKDACKLRHKFNEGLSAMLSDPNLYAYSNDIRQLDKNDRLVAKINGCFGINLEKHN